MNTHVQPYLFFSGRCQDALDFYRAALGAEVTMLMRFQESPEPPPPGMTPPEWGEKIMHAAFRIGSTTLMASDGCGQANAFSGFSLSFSAADEAHAAKVFSALQEGGEVMMPLTKTFWSPCYGMLKDRFGVSWMVNVEA